MTDNQQHIHLITAWINGSITAEEQERLQQLREEGKIDAAEVERMQSLYQNMEQLPVPEPSDDLRQRFYSRLDQAAKEEENSSPLPAFITQLIPRTQIWKWSAVAAVFITGLLIGNLFTPIENYRQDIQQLSTEVSQMREVMMMNLLEDQSPVERLKAVNIGSNMQSADHRVIESLLSTLNNDPNVNVRLASIEALIRHGDRASVRQGLIESITRQQSPQVQAALADAMLELQETESIEELRRLLDQEELDGAVRDKLKYTIAALS